jgi:hypothetical protein
MPTMKNGLFDLNSFEQQKQQQRQQPQPQQQGGVGGFLKRAGVGLISAPKHFINTDIVNPVKETAAQVTGNRKALQNARTQSNKELGLGEKGTDFTGGLKNFVGNTAEIGANFIAPGGAGIISKVLQGAKAGAVAGAGSELAQGKSVGDAVTGAVQGAAFGGATGGVLGVAGKAGNRGATGSGFLNKVADRGKALDAKSSGIEVGTPLKGGRYVTPEYEDKLQDFMRNGSQKYVEGGVKAGAPRDQAFSSQKVFQGVKSKLSEALDAINRPVEDGDKLTVGSQIQKRIDEDAGIVGTTKTWDKLQAKLNKTTDLKDLEKLRQEADDLAFSSEKAGKTSAARQAHHVRDAIDEYITPESPEYKAIKGDYQMAKDALDLTSKGAKNARGIKVPFAGVEVGSQATPAVKSKVGGFLSRFTKEGDEAPPAAEKALKSKGIPVRYETEEFAGKVNPETRRVTLTNPKIAEIEMEMQKLKDAGFDVSQKLGKTPGSLDPRFGVERQLTPDFTPVKPSPRLSSVELTGNKASIPLAKQSVERGIIHTPDVYADAPLPTAPKVGFLNRLTRGGVNSSTIPAGTAMAATSAPDQPQQQPTAEDLSTQGTDALTDALAPTDALGFGGGSTQSSDPYAPENLQASVQSIISQGGTQEDVAKFLANAKLIGELMPSGGSKPLNSTAAGVIADTQTGLQTLAALSGKIASSSANNPIIGKVRSLNPLDTNAQNLQASIATAKQIVGKALEGGVLRKEDEAKYAKILPTMNDTDAVAQHKIQELVKLIGGRLSEYQSNISGGSGGTDLASLGL